MPHRLRMVHRRRKRQRLSSDPSEHRWSIGPFTEPNWQTGKKMWLDLLPAEVCDRIALHGSNGHRSTYLLRLAKTSPTMRRAVVSALSSRMELCFNNCDQQVDGLEVWREWFDVFGNDLEELDIQYEREFKAYDLSLPFHCWPNLRTIKISDHPMLLKFLGRSPSMRDLKVHIQFQYNRSGRLAFNALSRIRVESLNIECNDIYYGRHTCPFTDLSLFGPGLNPLASSCPRLKALKVNCSCIPANSTHPVWQALRRLRSLREMTLHGSGITAYIPEFSVEKLSSLESVKLQWCSDAQELALRIGTSVTEYMTDRHYAFSAEQLQAFVGCPGLRKLALRLEVGADVVLPETVKELPDLKVLHLLWQPGYFRPPTEYDKASPGMLLRSVEVAPKLEDLHVIGICIELTELTAVLEALGPRLRRFSTTVVGQSQSPLKFVTELCRTAAKYNTGLLGFRLQGFVHRELFTDVTEEQVHEAKAAARWLGHNTMMRHDPDQLVRSIWSLLW